MNEDTHKKGLGIHGEHEERNPAQPFPALDIFHISLQGKGSWMNLLTLLEISPDALILVDGDGRIARLNSQAEAMFGYLSSELEGKTLETLLPERFRASHMLYRKQYAMAPRTRPMGVGLQLYGQSKDGSEFPVDISLSPLLFDGALHTLAAIRDITLRRRLEADERAARETAEARLALLQLVLDELPTCVYFVASSQARLVLANRAAVSLWGATWPVGQPMLEFLEAHQIQLFDTNSQALPPAAFATLRVVQEGQAVFQHQEIIRHEDGTSLPVLVNAVALDQRLLAGLEASGGSQHLSATEPAALVVIQDITLLKETEQLKDRFFGLVAHELRNPLTVLKGFATMLLRHAGGDKGAALAPWQQEALAEIDLATTRLNRLTEDLLDVVRLSAGRLVLHRESVDLVEVTRRVVAQMQRSSERHHLTLSTPLSHLQIKVDRGRIEQVLVNLLTNAMKYSPNGGNVEVTLQRTTEGQEALLSVRDRGIGIPQAEQARLFELFMRASNGERHGISGTGLGLYLCRELVSQHGGVIWFESAEGVGSTFSFRLPRSLESSVPGESEQSPSSEKEPGA